MEKLTGGRPNNHRRKVMACVHGFAGSGKTTMLLTFPPPLFMLNLDRDARHLIAKLPEHYEVYYEWLMPDVEATTPGLAKDYLARAEKLLSMASAYAKQHRRGSFILDGQDILWEYVQAALITQPEGTALRFKPANEWMFSFFQRLYISDLQVGMSAMAEEIWEGPKSTGRYRHGGWKHLDRYLTHDIRMFVRESVEGGIKPIPLQLTGLTHVAYIEQSKEAEHLVGRQYPSFNFALLYKLSYGESYPEEEMLWKPSAPAVAKG